MLCFCARALGQPVYGQVRRRRSTVKSLGIQGKFEKMLNVVVHHFAIPKVALLLQYIIKVSYLFIPFLEWFIVFVLML